jgi:NTP pyrophosphatase (non-canonical NTP hydrolase)
MSNSIEEKSKLFEPVLPIQIETARIVSTTTKVKERDQHIRKGMLYLPSFVLKASQWQLERTSLSISNYNLDLMTKLLLREIEEVLEQRVLEGLPGYDFKSEQGEVADVAFFLASLTFLLGVQGEQIDFHEVVRSANGQSSGSSALVKLTEVGGNISEKSFGKDLQYLWILWTSYLIHMKYPVDPNQVLTEYTIPKNSGNYIKRFLSKNPLFIKKMSRDMNEDEHVAYFEHYRRASRLIRDFIIAFIDADVEHTGMREEHYMRYENYIYSFTSELGYSSQKALDKIEEELYIDYANEVLAMRQKKTYKEGSVIGSDTILVSTTLVFAK